MGINQVLSLVCRNKAKEGRTPLLNANNPPGKRSCHGDFWLWGSRTWIVIAQKERILVYVFGKKVRFKGGKRETDLLVHAHWTNSPFSLVSFLFLSVFLSYLFLFFLLCFSFHFIKNALFFHPFFRARQGPFYSACRDQSFTILPLNCFCLVWAYLPTTKSVRHPPLPDRGRFVSFLSLP